MFVSETVELMRKSSFSFRNVITCLSLLQLRWLLTCVLFIVCEQSCLIGKESEALPECGTGCEGNGSNVLVRIYCTFRIQIEFRSFDLGPEQIPRATRLSVTCFREAENSHVCHCFEILPTRSIFLTYHEEK
jgi:hypothetical protein